MPLSPRTLRPSSSFTPKSISGLALWLDASATGDLYTTDAGPVTAVSSPLDIAGCALWLDGADSSAASMTLSGSLVETWKDKSGNGRDVSATGGDRPTLTNNYYGSASALTFSGSNVLYRSASGIAVGPCTSFIVFDESTAVPFGGLLVGSPSSGDDFSSTTGFITVVHDGTGQNVIRRASQATAAAGTALILDSETLGSSSTAMGKRLASFSVGASLGQCFLSGTASGSPDSAYSATGASSGIVVGGRYVSGAVSAAYRFNGKICEIIHFNTALSTADRARVESYLAAKWGIAGVHAAATSASDPVGYWRDRSGNGRHATQATGGSRPTIGSLGSRNAASFAGSNSVTVSSYPVKATSTYIYVSRHDDSNDTIFQTGGVNQFHSHLVEGAASKFRRNEAAANGVVLGGNNLGVGQASLWCVDYSNSALSVRYNGATVGSTLAASADGAISDSSRTTTLGRLSPTEAYAPLNGRIAEFMVYGGRNLSPSEKLRLERYLAAKWGIVLAPQVSNADAQDWVNRVYANGGTVTSSTAAAVNQFCNDIDAAGIRDRFYRLGLFAGTGLNAATVPLYLTPDKTVTNLFQFGTDMTNAAWQPGGNGAVTRAVSAEVGPLGYGYATKLTTPSSPFDVRQMHQLVPVQNRQVTLSFWAKTNTGTRQAQYFINGEYLDTFTVTSTWTRYTKTYTSTAASDGRSGLVTVSELSDAAGFILVWGMQIEYGATATGYTQPRYGNTTDTNVGPFVSGDYVETGASGGLTGNGTSKYLNTGVNASTSPPTNINQHLAAYCTAQAGSGSRFIIAANNSSSGGPGLGRLATGTTERFCTPGTTVDGGTSLLSGFLAGNADATNVSYYRNGTALATVATPSLIANNNDNIYVFAGNSGGTASLFSDRRLMAYSYGLGMSSSQWSAYNTAMQAFQTALGRNV